LLPQLLAVAIDRWHARYRTSLTAWLAAVGELEALASLGTCAFEHPADPFPEIAETAAQFVAEGLAHPLMPDSAAVRNDVALGAVQTPPGSTAAASFARVIVVSGSNMSGKSTLLRSVGVNVVLALAGAPVRAVRLRLSPLVIGAT